MRIIHNHIFLTHYNGYYYRYDGFGRLIERRHPVTQLTQQFFYNSQHQLIEARVNDIYHRSTTLYTYDALGRRTSKSTKHDDKYEKRQHHEQTNFFWQGMRLSGEQHSTQTSQRLHYIYNQDSYEPIARVMIETTPNTQSESVQLEYFHTQLNDLPTELTNEQGEMVWRGDYQLFGQLKQQQTSSPYIAAQNLRFAGQYYDKETGLHYNTFRYYDPNCGRFTQPDPIGLAGGINLYQYAPNTLTWVDPWGWSHLNTNGASGNFGVYEIVIDDELYKFGKADLNRVTKSSNLPTRLHQQLTKLRKLYPDKDIKGNVIEKGHTTTRSAKAAETAKLNAYYKKTGKVPVGNQKSYKPKGKC